MKLLTALGISLMAIVIVPAAKGGDLKSIDRTITKQPAYKSKAVKYGLLVFGVEAKNRVWLAHDGDILYVDRNGNGDLTEDGERIAAAPRDQGAASEDTAQEFEIRELAVGGFVHRNVIVQCDSRSYSIGAEIAIPGWKGSGIDGRVRQQCGSDPAGGLQFAEHPQKAPVIHFAGPWQILLQETTELRVGRTADLFLALGSCGIGPGTTAWIEYAGIIPRDRHPVAVISFAPARGNTNAVRERFELKERC